MRIQHWLILGVLVCANLIVGLLVFGLLTANAASLPIATRIADWVIIKPPPTFRAVQFPTELPSATPFIQPTRQRPPTWTPLPTWTPQPTYTPLPTVFPGLMVRNIVGHKQTYPLSCESRSAADWAAHFGVAIDEIEFFNRLPQTLNPETGFVGDVQGTWGHIPPYDYGVHAGPVAEQLRGYGLAAYAHKNLSWEDVRSELDQGRPVLTWVYGHVERGGKALTYITPENEAVVVVPREHTVLVVGYLDDNVVILDGEKIYYRSRTAFLEAWKPLENMAITATSNYP